jgi:hypothetical protein
MSSIQLRFKRSFYVRHGIVGGMTAFFCAVIALSARHAGPLVQAGVPVLFMGPWLFLVLREYFLAAREMDEKGVTRHDGRRFLWNDLDRVQEVHLIMHGRQGSLNHVDLRFAGGKVRILYLVLENGWKGIEFAKQREAERLNPLRRRLLALIAARTRAERRISGW